jgi:DNA-binding PadR family transcriptional regulator
MLVKGWLTAEWGVSENNRKARFYELTPLGAAQLKQQVRQFEDTVRAISLVIRTA